MSETITDPLLGRLIDGRYVVRECVGAGGMATVYLAFDKRLERLVALKVMRAGLGSDLDSTEFTARFRREAKAAARLTHPGMVRVYDQGIDGEISYLTMEYVEGENLRQRMNHEGCLTLGEALTVTEGVLDALAAAHRQHLVHRDIKPENVLLDEDGRTKVADFGLARAVTEVTSTSTGTIMGTVAYLGPELVSRGTQDARTDVYAAGILLYEMVTGHQPFTGDSAIDVATRHVHEDVPAPSQSVAWLPPEFDELVANLVARDPDERPHDAAVALTMVRQARALIDDPTLDRRADPPSGSIALMDRDDDATTVFDPAPAGATVALPIGLGESAFAPVTNAATLIEDDPEAREPLAPQRRGLWWAGAILAAILVLGGVGFWWYNSIGPGAYTTVPTVTGTQQEAEKALQAAGLVTETQFEYDDVVLEGIVIATDPTSQKQVPNGAKVTIIVSQGPKMTTVPSLVGATEGDSINDIREAGFKVGDSEKKFSDTVKKGEVLEQDPEAGESVRHDTTINLVVSDGPEPIEIPNVVGSTEADAQETLADDALVVTVKRERSAEQDKGKVFKQDPAAGDTGTRTDAITIWVSDGPPLVDVPNFVFDPVDEAVQAAKDVGLVPELRARWPFSTRNQIADQSIAPGTDVERGTTIVLIYN
ncbi:Stk1 family PASTA domain-containing Ser/Thr kinase [Demequina aurantiaca]|uniref:Stk1 family PASTA domain-containing Ser/Thr kinase n=1 Tax=Demequina aurantiaca TaxID=676200 RepID=UPI0007822729|nr:Stk1 family PASTA domain-containing Ser/Thr kinase [Demequina aurantiaca]